MSPNIITLIVALAIGGLAGYVTALREGIINLCKDAFQSQKPFFIVTPRLIQALMYVSLLLALAGAIAIISLMARLDSRSLTGVGATVLGGMAYAGGLKAAPKSRSYYLALCLRTARQHQRSSRPQPDIERIITILEQQRSQ